jgi:hypothetical protein
MSHQIHALATFIPGESVPYYLLYRTLDGPESVWTWWRDSKPGPIPAYSMLEKSVQR